MTAHCSARMCAAASVVIERAPSMTAESPAVAEASRIGLGLPPQQMLRPPSPTLGQLRNRKQPRHLVTIARIDAKDVSDGEVVIRPLQDADLVSGAHVALDDDSQIGSG